MAEGQGILSLSIKEISSLYTAYMPFVKNGGLFIPTSRQYSIGDEVFLVIGLVDESERLGIAGKVIWITPVGATGTRTPGIGVQFADQDNGQAKSRIEALLGAKLASTNSTHTM